MPLNFQTSNWALEYALFRHFGVTPHELQCGKPNPNPNTLTLILTNPKREEGEREGKKVGGMRERERMGLKGG
jgi:hypothetical protein